MSKRLTINDVINLPADHPKMIEFMKQVEEQNFPDVAHDVIQDEQSLEYFDRHIAGDR